jgi:SAM-dependent methyltransferase
LDVKTVLGDDPEITELETLVQLAKVGKAAGANDLDHMDGAAAAFTYIRIADLVATLVELGEIAEPVLDWGCGYGQVSWLLRRRGVPVVSYEIEKRAARKLMAPLSSVDVQYGSDPVRLPYASSSAGAVLSVGVLEHVPDMGGSLREIGRVLRPEGLFLIFMFPNRYSWAEWVADLRHRSAHPNKFTLRQSIRIFTEHGFAVERKWRRNFLPRNLTGFSPAVKGIYGRYYRAIESLDSVLANVPPTAIFSGVLEMILRKRL